MRKNILILLLNVPKIDSFVPSTFLRHETRTLYQKKRITLSDTLCSIKNNRVSFGDFDSGSYCKFRNIYYFPNNNNIDLISKKNVKKLFYGWRMSLLNENLIYEDDFKEFYCHLDNEDIEYFSWVPCENKKYVKGLIAANVNKKNKVITIKSILLAPPKEEQILYQADYFLLLISDLQHLKFLYDWMDDLTIDLKSL